ncbi:MAG TPA: enolase [Terriglobales bacterium]
MSAICNLEGMEILDSRGRPTVLARCELKSGAQATASAPSGASKGTFEAYELRDGDPRRYRGLGCRQAAANIGGILLQHLKDRDFATQEELDNALTAADGTSNLSRIGANAILAVSIAFARAQATERGVPLYEHFASLAGLSPRMPVLTINLFSGGKHAGQQVAIQDVLIVPLAAQSIDEALTQSAEVYQCAAELCGERYGMRMLVADEGGLAPPFESVRAMLDLAMEAIRRAGFHPGREIALAVDVASSHFFERGLYHLDGRSLTSQEMIATIADWVRAYPIVSVEDGLAEEEWSYWPELRAALTPSAITLGDDLLCTNPTRIARAIESRACDALLLKVNQIGTLTGALEALRLARGAGWKVVVSVRSGETEDDWAADLAVGWQGDFFKNGSLTRSERLAKYNRLLRIERENAWRSGRG